MDVVRLSLDRFMSMGIRCVKFAVHYPLLRPDFPAASDYLAFYQEVVKEAHARDIKVMPHVTVLLAETPFSPFQDIFKGLDLMRFKQEYRNMLAGEYSATGDFVRRLGTGIAPMEEID